MNIFGSLLFLHGHVANAELARQLASPSTDSPACAAQPAAPVQQRRAVEQHLALVGYEHAGHAVQQRRFTRARGPHDGHGFAVAHRQADAFEDPLLGE